MHAPWWESSCVGRSERRASSAADLRREHLRLRRVFTTLVFTLAPAALAQACGPRGTPQGGDAGTGGEAGVEAEAEAEAEADAPPSPDADGSPPEDAGAVDRCATLISEADAGADAAAICFYTLPCGLPSGLFPIGCDVYSESPADAAQPFGCSLLEGEGCAAGTYVPGDGGAVTLSCPGCLGGSGGRRPRGLVRPPALRAPTALGAYFARMAYDEAASVHAFRRLRDDLARHDAPDALVLAAARSARDEERHARVMARYARGQGATVDAPRVRRGKPRSLEAVARENAVEGCVHETFGALLLHWQAAHARDASVRRTFARIAADETRHAALAWAVARWAEGRLDAAGRARVAAARARALDGLVTMGAAAPEPLGCGTYDARDASPVGRPDRRARAALLSGLILRLGVA